MKIIVTGGAGFIGSHITDEYIKAGHKVVVIDNLATGFRKNINLKAKFYKVDICDFRAVEKIFLKEKPEVVNHHAAIADIAKALRDPLPTYNANLMGTINVLLAFGKHGSGPNRRFIFASSGAVYGTPKIVPVTEKTLIMPESSYGLSKFLGEEVIKFYAGQFGFNYIIFRYPNVYGPRQNPKGEAGVTAIWIGLIKEGNQPVIFGDGGKFRDYTFIKDVVRAHIFALHRGKNDVFTLGWGKGITDRQVFDIIASRMGFDENPVYKPFRVGEAYGVCLSSDKAKKVLKWKPQISFKDGINKVINALN